MFTEEEVANLISMVADMIVTKDAKAYSDYYKQLCDNRTISDDLASHIMSIVQNCRHNY